MFTIMKVTPDVLKSWNADLAKFLNFGWNVVPTIVDGWYVSPNESQLQVIKNNTDMGLNLKVLYDGFHGTSIANAKSILSSGFRMDASSGGHLGKTFYVAAHLDRAAFHVMRRIPENADSWEKPQEGYVFHGDLIVSGNPVRKPRDVGSYQYVADSVYADEVGLVDPSRQFIVRRLYKVETVHKKQSSKYDPTVRFGFERPTPTAKYKYVR